MYKGEVARRIANDITADRGLITAEDLAAYRPVESDPLVGSYRGYTIHTAPPASAGGPALLNIWNQLEHFDLKAMGAGSAILLHVMAEAMKLGYVDRARALGAPAFVTAPVKGFIDREYAGEGARLINPDRARPMKKAISRPPKSKSVTTLCWTTQSWQHNLM